MVNISKRDKENELKEMVRIHNEQVDFYRKLDDMIEIDDIIGLSFIENLHLIKLGKYLEYEAKFIELKKLFLKKSFETEQCNLSFNETLSLIQLDKLIEFEKEFLKLKSLFIKRI